MWYIFACIGMLLGAINNILRKKTALNIDTTLALVYQYFWICVSAIIIGIIYAMRNHVNFLPNLTVIQWLGVLSIGIVWYLGIVFFVYALKKEPAWVVSMVANISVFMMFATNRYLFPQTESLSLIKIGVSIIFFIIVAWFMFASDHQIHLNTSLLNKNLLYPIATALCWTYFFVANNYIVKHDLLDPIQTVRVTETAVGICALIWYLIRWGNRNQLIQKRYQCGQSWVMVWLGVSGALSGVFFYLAYSTISANIVNVIRLFMIIITSVLSRWRLKDYMNRKQIILLIIGMIALIIFVMI